jgi:hypothetical protein
MAGGVIAHPAATPEPGPPGIAIAGMGSCPLGVESLAVLLQCQYNKIQPMLE